MKTKNTKTLTGWNLALFAPCLAVALFITGCASTQVSNRNEVVTGQLPKPATIWVYDFAATPDGIPAESALSGAKDLDTTPPTPEELAEGQKLGSEIAAELVTDIRTLGMPSERAGAETKPQINDIVIHGYFLSIQKGNEAERVAIGFGKGESDLKPRWKASR